MKKRSNRVILGMFVVMIVVFALLTVNIFSASVMGIHLRSGENIETYGQNANIRTSPLVAKRGKILDSRNNVIAEDVTSYNLYAVLDESRKGIGGVPAFVVDKEKTAQALSSILGGEPSYYLEQLSNEGYQTEFGVKGKDLAIEVKQQIEALDLPGLEFTASTKRHYPLGEFASHLVGFSTLDQELGKQVGRMGLESIYDEDLEGKDGYDKHQVSANGFRLPNSTSETVPAEEGSDVYLTLDKPIQQYLEDAMSKTLDFPSVEHVWATIMDVETGKVLATGNYPTFNPETKEIEDYMFYPSQYTFEPGSTMKAFTYAAAINEGKYNGQEVFDSREAYLRALNKNDMIRVTKNDVYDAKVQNAYGKDWGQMTFDQGFHYSSNVAIVELLINHIDTKILEDYLDRFGFFKPVGFDGLQEEAGTKSYEYAFDKITNGFGQGSTVTMLQMVQAYSAILNDGKMMKPYVVEQVVDKNGEVTYQGESKVVGTPITKETAKQVQKLMHEVVTEPMGTGYYYRVDELEFLAKTGTAQMIIDGKYSDTRMISSVAIGLPVEQPKYLIFFAHDGHVANINREQFEAVRELIVNVANEYNLIEKTTEVNDEKKIKDVKITTMPNLVNHSYGYADSKLEGALIHKVKLGEGENIIDQYPKAGDKIVSGQHVLLYTGTGKVVMPNMIGWSRKEVSAFWSMTGLAVTLDGYGSVVKQSVPEGTIVYPETKVKVDLK